MLQDNNFRPLQYLALPLPGAALGAHGGAAAAAAAAPPDAEAEQQRRRARGEATARAAQLHLWFPCGVVRGALAQLGVECTVEADARALPACAFCLVLVLEKEGGVGGSGKAVPDDRARLSPLSV